ncbi:MAG: CDP-glucose 4,6-dehydratase [Eubacterium sp.]|nr:CDP-glucose 4,6-dehydratase [Eubacterium sp.]
MSEKKLDWWKGKKVLVTGHTGFKGSWLCEILHLAGAEVCGYALAPEEENDLFDLLGLDRKIKSVIGDVRDFDRLRQTMMDFQPEVILHLAAQPIVRTSYVIPRETFETNVMGTVNLMESIRLICQKAKAEGKESCVRSVVNITTDKVYLNREIKAGYKEEDPLNGYDPYSNSKSCSDLATQSYQKSFFQEEGPAISTARAGNVIGGGDFAKDRIIPDCVRAAAKGEQIVVRNPASVRPFQHVLEPLFAYLLLAQRQYEDRTLAGAYNIGPDPSDIVTVEKITGLFVTYWGGGASWKHVGDNGPHEASLLMLDNAKIHDKLGWTTTWDIDEAVKRTVEWSKVWAENGDVIAITDKQICEFFQG